MQDITTYYCTYTLVYDNILLYIHATRVGVLSYLPIRPPPLNLDSSKELRTSQLLFIQKMPQLIPLSTIVFRVVDPLTFIDPFAISDRKNIMSTEEL